MMMGKMKLISTRTGTQFLLSLVLVTGFSFVAVPGEGGVAHAETGDCADELYGGIPPRADKPNLLNNTVELCFQEFAVLHSGISKTPLWSAEKLTAQRIKQAYSVERDDVFHEETRLPSSDRSELSDYSRSGFDRGHMSPAADMATVSGQNESFSLANMIPQSPALNRGLWAKMEGVARSLALQYGDVFVVTGPAFTGSTIQRLHGRVMVPTYVFKAVYIPSVNQAGVWWAANSTDGKTYEDISLAELEKRTGFDIFPNLPDSVKSVKVDLPDPYSHQTRSYSSDASSNFGSDKAGDSQSAKHSETSTWGRVGVMLLHKLLR